MAILLLGSWREMLEYTQFLRFSENRLGGDPDFRSDVLPSETCFPPLGGLRCDPFSSAIEGAILGVRQAGCSMI